MEVMLDPVSRALANAPPEDEESRPGSRLRIAGAIQRFADTGAGNVKALHAMHPPEFRLRVGDGRVRFHDHGDWIDILRIRNRREGYR